MREFLKGLELDKETIDTIMAEHGKIITELKEKTSSLESDIKSKEEQIKTANTEIESYKNMDIESIKKSADDYKTKFEQAEESYKEELRKRDYSDAIKEAINNSGLEFSSLYARNGIINDIMEKGLKMENGKLLGFDDAIKDLKTSQPTAFVEKQKEGGEETPPPMYGGAGKDTITPTEIETIKNSYKKAKENRDTTEMARIIRVASEKGIKSLE